MAIAAPPASAASTLSQARCTAPYDPGATRGAGYRTYLRSAPAIRWLRDAYGYEADHIVRPERRNVFRSVALRRCALNRGAITVWSTNPPAMNRRAWLQPWIRHIDIHWVRVRYGGVDAIRAVRFAVSPESRTALQEALGGTLTTAGDDPSRDCFRVGIDAKVLPIDADARAFRIIRRASCVELQQDVRIQAGVVHAINCRSGRRVDQAARVLARFS